MGSKIELEWKVEQWSERDSIERVFAICDRLDVGLAAFGASVAAYPNKHITLRHGARVIRDSAKSVRHDAVLISRAPPLRFRFCFVNVSGKASETVAQYFGAGPMLLLSRIARRINWTAASVASGLLALSSFVHAAPYGSPNAIPLTSDTAGDALRWGRCTKQAFPPDARIAACSRLIRDGHMEGQYAWLYLGEAYAEERDNVNARSAYNRAVAFDHDREPLEHRAIFYAVTGDYKKATADIEAMATIRGSEAQVLSDRCWIRALANKELDAGLVDCDHALELEPGSSEILDRRGFILFRLGRSHEAIDTYSQALIKEPHAASSLYLRGIAERAMGQASAADADIAAAIAIDQKIGDTYSRYGVNP